jgi:hypothetical protein
MSRLPLATLYKYLVYQVMEWITNEMILNEPTPKTILKCIEQQYLTCLQECNTTRRAMKFLSKTHEN